MLQRWNAISREGSDRGSLGTRFLFIAAGVGALVGTVVVVTGNFYGSRGEPSTPQPGDRPPAATAKATAPAIGAAATLELLKREEAWAAGHKFSTVGLLMRPSKGADAKAAWEVIITSVEGKDPAVRAAETCATVFATPAVLQHNPAARNELEDDFNGISDPPADSSARAYEVKVAGDCEGLVDDFLKNNSNTLVNFVHGMGS